MAEGKKSVLLYCDILHTVEQLDDDTAGKLFKHYLRYINDLSPETDNVLVKIAFEPIKQNLKRDLVKWETKQQEKSINGRMGNLKRYNIDLYEQVNKGLITIDEAEIVAKSRKASLSDNLDSEATNEVAKVAVNVNVKDTVNVNVKDILNNNIMSDFKEEKPKKPNYNPDVDIIYSLYPTECYVKGSSTGKGSKNKEKIRSIIKEKGFEWLYERVENYLVNCKANKIYLKNFGTFLNNIPEPVELKQKTSDRNKYKITM